MMAQQAAEGRGLWSLAWQRFLADRVGVVSALLVMLGLLIVRKIDPVEQQPAIPGHAADWLGPA
ncbi:MAG: hypothetical protein EBX67_09695 [Betaproteobacteria bacterium]|nr:hypothetical protein [Betaproteobacteria bacterium]